MARFTNPTVSSCSLAPRSLHEPKSKVLYWSSTACATPWYSRVKTRRTEVMCTGRYERLRTSTFVFSRLIAADIGTNPAPHQRNFSDATDRCRSSQVEGGEAPFPH